MSDPKDSSGESGEIENPEDLPSQVHVTERDGVTRIDIAEDATTRPGDPDLPEQDRKSDSRRAAIDDGSGRRSPPSDRRRTS